MRIAAAGTSFSSLPCQVWQGYRVTIAHRVEVEVGADGLVSALPSVRGRRPCAASGRRLNNFCEYLHVATELYWVNWLPQVGQAYNASPTMGIEHTPFTTKFGLSHEEPPGLLLPMRPSFPFSMAAHERLQHLLEVHEFVEGLHGNGITGNRTRHLRVRSRTP
jgi:hypothetical protein